MSELKMVIKVFIFSALLLMLSQIRVGGDTIENKTTRWLMHSSSAKYLQGVAAGAIKAGQTFFMSSKQTLSSTVENFQNGKSEYYDENADEPESLGEPGSGD